MKGSYMLRNYLLVFSLTAAFFCGTGGVFASKVFPLTYAEAIKKDTGKKANAGDTNKNKPKADQFVLKPVIGLGTGMLSYIGNVKYSGSSIQNPMVSKIGYDLMFAQKMTPAIEFQLYALFGSLSVTQRSTDINWNFYSQIRGGGFHLMFKVLPKQNMTPYFVIGGESFEYLTKTDMYDGQGNKYYYWNDGTIRNIAQTAPNAASATVIYRDYTYETDMRSLNINNTGKYELQTFALPVGIGFMFHIGKRADFLMGTTLHYAFTNHIDGLGDSTGGMKHDMFLMSSIALRFDLTRKQRKEDTSGGYLPESLEDVDFAALMNDDYDHDGVRDWDDSCAGTPKGVAVDSKGCPIDADHDGVPDYLDKEENSPKGSIVDVNGVALTDSMIFRQYQMYVDSTGQFAQIEIDSKVNPLAKKNTEQVRYTVQLGKFTKGIPPDIMDKLLSIPDVKSTMLPDSSTVYTVGDFTDFSSAQSKQQQLIQTGLTDSKVAYRKGKDIIVTDGPVKGDASGNNPTNANPGNTNPTNTNPGNNNPTNTNPGNTNPTNTNPTNTNPTNIPPLSAGIIVYRIQLGAYNHKLSRDVFPKIDNLVEVKTENGFYTYSAGSFTNYQDAVNYKIQLATIGYPDAFIKAYQNGKRIALDKAGATYVKPTKEDMNEAVTQENNTLDKTQISFKVQLGVFKDAPPADMAAKFKEHPDIVTEKDSTGLTRYVLGSYNNYNAAKTERDLVANDPLLKGAFVVAYFKDQQIPLAQALSILKQ
jgi:cell division protein FtsN